MQAGAQISLKKGQKILKKGLFVKLVGYRGVADSYPLVSDEGISEKGIRGQRRTAELYRVKKLKSTFENGMLPILPKAGWSRT